jgi:hypothetical protein
MFRIITCLFIYPMVIDSSSYSVVCLYYECLLNWIDCIFYNMYMSLYGG